MRDFDFVVSDIEQKIISQKRRDRNTLLLLDYKIDKEKNIEEKIKEHFKSIGITANIKKCPKENLYEITLWW